MQGTTCGRPGYGRHYAAVNLHRRTVTYNRRVHTTILPGPRPSGCRPHYARRSTYTTYPWSLGCPSGGRWYGWHRYPSLVVVQPRTVYVDRPVETAVETYVDQPIIEQPVLPEPAFDQYRDPQYADPFEAGGATLLPQATPSSPQDPRDTLRQGDAAFAVGDYAEARRHYIHAQLEGVYAGEATLAYGLARFAEGYYAVSALALRRGLAAVPDAISYPLDITLLYGDPDELQRHLDTLSEHLTRRPDDAYAWFVLGYVRFGQGDPSGAAEAFERCIALDPQDTLVHLLHEAALAVLDPRPGAPPDGQAAPSLDLEAPEDQVFLQPAPPGLL